MRFRINSRGEESDERKKKRKGITIIYQHSISIDELNRSRALIDAILPKKNLIRSERGGKKRGIV